MDTHAETLAVSADDVRAAADLIRGNVLRTPLIPAPKLSELTGADVYVKYENLQVTNSFKDRGALVKLLSLSQEQRRRGVIAMSAGNHAQSVAYHSARLGVPALIVMPETTPYVKIGNTEAFGAEVVLSGATLAESKGRMEEIAKARQLTPIHPYDDARIIAGQGTVALEVLDEQPQLDVLVIPIGGGGLIAGNAIAAKDVRPEIEVVGVEAALFPSMYHAVRGETGVCGGQTLAEGIAVKAAGELTVPIVKALVSEIILVDEDLIERAICAFASLQKTMAEGAGAAGLAAMLDQPETFEGKKVGLYLSGGNIDPRVLASVIVRGLGREGKIVSLRITISDQPGMLGRIASLLGEERANILEVSHRRMFLDVPAKGATLDLLMESKDRAHARQVMERLEHEGFQVRVLESLGGREITAE
ncbi:MAG: threonine ammonia-lyase [Geminicoccaceae bacterium]